MLFLARYFPLAGIEYALCSVQFRGQSDCWRAVYRFHLCLVHHGDQDPRAPACPGGLGAFSCRPTARIPRPRLFFSSVASALIPSPLFTIYDVACAALGAALERTGAVPAGAGVMAVAPPDVHLDEREIESVRSVSERTMADQALLLENSMGLLAIATTTAPFLGLLGTVWGRDGVIRRDGRDRHGNAVGGGTRHLGRPAHNRRGFARRTSLCDRVQRIE